MKALKFSTFLFILVNPWLFSCNDCVKGSGNTIKVERVVPAFNSIKLKGSFNLYIKKDSIQKVEIVGDDNIVSLLETPVKGSVLEIGLRNQKCIRKHRTLDVYISVPAVASISLDGSGNIEAQNTFTGGNLELVLKGSGDVNFLFDGNSIASRIDGSGNINLSGSSTFANYVISGSGGIYASNLTTSTTEAKISGSGNIETRVSDNLTASISGSGDIIYYGNPMVYTLISGSGKVIKR